MRILDRYITKSVLTLFLTCILSFLFLYVIIDIFANLDDFLKQHTHIITLLQYYLSYLPIIFVQVAPISTLLAVLYTFGTFNRNNEIIAMPMLMLRRVNPIRVVSSAPINLRMR